MRQIRYICCISDQSQGQKHVHNNFTVLLVKAKTQRIVLTSHTTHAAVQADQQSDSSPPQSAVSADGQEADGMDTPPYILKFSNHLGDVRLQSKGPSVEGEQVLYFTAQWKQDGGGVYDVTKLTNPEVSPCAVSELYTPTVA